MVKTMTYSQVTSKEWFYSQHTYLLQMTYWIFKIVSKMKWNITNTCEGHLDCPVSFCIENTFL